MVSVGCPELVLCADVYRSPGALAFMVAVVRWLHRRRKRANSCGPPQRGVGRPANVVSAWWLAGFGGFSPWLGLSSSTTFCQIFIAAFDRFRHDLDPGVAVGLGTELIALYGFF